MRRRNKAKQLFQSPIALNLPKEDGQITLDCIVYDKEDYDRRQSDEWATAEKFISKNKGKTLWVNCYPPENKEVVESLANHFQINSFLMADAVDFSLRSKIWNTESHLFCSFKMKKPDVDETEHISFIIGKNVVISFQEIQEDVFNHIRERLANNNGLIRQKGADYLLFLLCDAIVDQFTLLADSNEHSLLESEETMYLNPNSVKLHDIFKTKQDQLDLLRDIRTANDIIKSIQESEFFALTLMVKTLFASISHNTQYGVESFSRQLEHSKNLTDLYFAQQNNKLNEMIKLLTIMSAVFIPLSFIAGFYGMNFTHMTELSSPAAYPMIITLMLVVALGILWYFKRKRWL